MAQKFIPLYITEYQSDSPPALNQTVGVFKPTQDIDANRGAALGIPRAFIVSPLRIESQALGFTAPNADDFASPDIDVLLSFRQHSFADTGDEYSVGLGVRCTQDSAHTNSPMIGYALFPNMTRIGHRGIKLQKLGGTRGNQTYTDLGTPTQLTANMTFGSARDFSTGQGIPPVRYLRVKIATNTITCYCYWDDDNSAAQTKTYVYTDTSSPITGAGTAGIIFGAGRAPECQFHFLSFANGTDTPLEDVPPRQLDGVVYQPGSDNRPASGFPVRAYHRGTGTPVGSAISSTPSGEYSITDLNYGAEESILASLDTNDDNQEWGHAIKGPVTPVLTVA